MSTEEFTTGFAKLPEPAQIVFLSHLAAEVTVWARDTYEAGTDNVLDAPRLRVFNEYQHRIAGQLAHLIDHSTDRYPADWFAQYLVLGARELGCEAALLAISDPMLRSAGVSVPA